jgi:hypothetical protein
VKFKVVLKRMLSNHNNLRTDVIEGMAMHLPSVGMPFILFGESLTDPAATRVVTTTPVMETKVNDSVWWFKTKNSTYELTVLEMPELE